MNRLVEVHAVVVECYVSVEAALVDSREHVEVEGVRNQSLICATEGCKADLDNTVLGTSRP